MQFLLASVFRLFPFLLLFSTHLINGENVTPAYVLGDVAINCGCLVNSTAPDGRRWVAETPLLQPQGNSKISASKLLAADSTPYTTSRVSPTSFSYTFRVNPGQKFTRLHFYPASYQGFQRSRDLFTVKANSFTLLQNFSASITADYLGVRYVVKEFCLNVNESGSLKIEFFASQRSSKRNNFYAFINGIEIISMPSGLYYTPDDNLGAPRVVGQSDRLYYVDNSTALELIQRLNVGGRSISPAEDAGMFRRWSEDSDYLLNYGLEQVHHFFPVIEQRILMSLFVAPPHIYQTCRKLRKSSEIQGEHLFTWKIPVDLGFAYLVRLHFCHLGVNSPDNSGKDFNIVIQNLVAETHASVIKWSGGSRIPVYRDYVVLMKGDRSEGKRDLSISLQSGDDLVVEQLKGLEIFKLSNLDNSLATTAPPSSKHTSSYWTLRIQKIIAFSPFNSITTALTILLALMNATAYKLRRIREYNHSQSGNVQSARNTPSCRDFSLAEILSATQNFNDALIIGRGGFGKVYKGFLCGSAELLAIKRLKRGSKQGAREFWREIVTLSKVRHTNLVSLIGYCDESEEMILVYEYMPRGTLADNLYKNYKIGKRGTPLTWEQRLRICIGAAHGLEYLHNGTKYGVIHRDVKDTNILLDENFIAKISDFGLSKLKKVGETQGEFSTKVRGTVGYFDPQYLLTRKLSTRGDVYAFGMVLLVVLSGRPALEIKLFEEPWSLLFWFRECMKKGDIGEVIDLSLKGDILPNSLNKFLEIVENCLHHQPKQRPTMAQVVAHLEQALEKQQGTESCTPGDSTVAPKPCPSGTSQEIEFYELKVPHIPTDESSVSAPEEGNTSKEIQNPDIQDREAGLESRETASNTTMKQLVDRPQEVLSNIHNPLERKYLPLPTRHIILLKDIRMATHDFNDEFIILKRKSYQLYRVFSKSGSGMVVIKRMNSFSRRAKKDFETQFSLLDSLPRHMNVVCILGYCREDDELILAYEYVPTLDNYLYIKSRNIEDYFCLTWEQRLRICRDVALGLEHLHKANVMHGDVNIFNILLDENFAPKISGFGKSPGGPNKFQNSTLTRFFNSDITDSYDAYMDPYAFGLSNKARDVYSFGILLLVVLSGRPAVDHTLPRQQHILRLWFQRCCENESLSQVMDQSLEGGVPSASLGKFLELINNCLLPIPINRPVMNEVVSFLQEALNLAQVLS